MEKHELAVFSEDQALVIAALEKRIADLEKPKKAPTKK